MLNSSPVRFGSVDGVVIATTVGTRGALIPGLVAMGIGTAGHLLFEKNKAPKAPPVMPYTPYLGGPYNYNYYPTPQSRSSVVRFGSAEGAAIAAADGRGGVVSGLLAIGIGYVGCYFKNKNASTSPPVRPIQYAPYPSVRFGSAATAAAAAAGSEGSLGLGLLGIAVSCSAAYLLKKRQDAPPPVPSSGPLFYRDTFTYSTHQNRKD